MKFSIKEFFIHEVGWRPVGKGRVPVDDVFDDTATMGTHIPNMPNNPYIDTGIDPNTCEVCGQEKGNPECKYCRNAEHEMGRAEHVFGQREATEFQLPVNLLREFQHVPPVPRPGATAWSSPSEPVTIKKFFNHDGNLDIDLQSEAGLASDEPLEGNTGWVVIDAQGNPIGDETYMDYEEAAKMAGQIEGGEVASRESLEQPAGSMDDFGDTGSPEEYSEDDFLGDFSSVGKGPIGKGTNPHDYTWTQGSEYNDDEPYKMSEGGKGSGRPKGSKNKPKSSTVISPGGAPKSDLPDELPDSWFDGDQSDIDFKPVDQPSDPSGFERQPDDELSFLDDPNLGSDNAPIAKAAPRAPKQVPQGRNFDSEFDSFGQASDPSQPLDDPETEMTWDEFRATSPEEAQDAQSEFGSDLQGATFKTHGGFTHMTDPNGKRWKHTQASGWLDMDDGNTPAGEF